MPYNGAGNFVSLPPPQYPAVAGDVIRAAYFNAVINDLIAGLTNAVTRDGQSPATQNLPMAGKKHTGVADATAVDQYASYGQLLNAATLATFLQAGTGTVTRSIQDKLREPYVSLSDFLGADPTGASSSSTALQAALTASKNVFIPPGNWVFATGVTAQADTCLRGANRETASLSYTGAGVFITLTDGGYAHFEELSLYGPHTLPAYFTAGAYAVSINGNLTMRRVRMRYWERALNYITNGFYLKFWDCDFAYNKIHGYNIPGNNAEFFGCRFAFCDSVIQIGGFDGPVNLHGGSIENVTSAALSLISGAQTAIALFGVYVENVGATSVAGTGLAAGGYKAAWLVQGAFKAVTIINCPGQIAGFQRVIDVNTATSCNVVGLGNHWIYKLDGGLSDTQFIYFLGDNSNSIILDSSEGRSDVTYTPAATYTITGVQVSQPRNLLGTDPVSNFPLVSKFSHQTVTYSAAMTIDASKGSVFSVSATNATAFTFNAPTNGYASQQITVVVRNTSGAALGAVTWNAAFKLAAWTQPASGFSRSITFEYNGTNWVEVSRTPVDVPN